MRASQWGFLVFCLLVVLSIEPIVASKSKVKSKTKTKSKEKSKHKGPDPTVEPTISSKSSGHQTNKKKPPKKFKSSSKKLKSQSKPLSSVGLHVVIARYKEPTAHLSWLQTFPHTVYNRGDPLNSTSPLHTVDRLENVGRESFLYLSHLYEHYDSLPEVLIFSQAQQQYPKRYADKNFQQDVNALAENRSLLTAYDAQDGFAFCIPGCMPVDYPMDLAALRETYGSPAVDSLLPYAGYESLLGVDIDRPRYTGTGCFFVTAEAVRRRPRAFYADLARRIGTQNDPIEGHFFERAWPQIFLSTCASTEKYHCLLPKYEEITC